MGTDDEKMPFVKLFIVLTL